MNPPQVYTCSPLYVSFGLLWPLHYVLFILYFLATVPIPPPITTLLFLPILSHLNLYKSRQFIKFFKQS